MELKTFLGKIVIAAMPVLMGGLSWLFIDVITLKADVFNQKENLATLKDFFVRRFDRIEHKLDKLYDRN